MASVAALKLEDLEQERDCLKRGIACGVNSGWLDLILRKHSKIKGLSRLFSESVLNAEKIWDNIEKWGWAGKRFSDKTNAMISNISAEDHKKFHEQLYRPIEHK